MIYLEGTGVLTLCEVEAYDINMNKMPLSNAWQSSTFQNYVASYAIDGNTNTDVFQDSCTRTDTSSFPLWRADLSSWYDISVVRIFNRDDFEERLVNAQVQIGGFDFGPLVTTSDVLKNPLLFLAPSVTTNEIEISTPGTNKRITICELEMYDIYGKKMIIGRAHQSNTPNRVRGASEAIDDDRSAILTQNSCSDTEFVSDPWWRAEYVTSNAVASVHIYIREDNYQENMIDAEVTVNGVFFGKITSDMISTNPIIFTAPPTASPTFSPTASPTISPTFSPTASPVPTFEPTLSPSSSPTLSPTQQQTIEIAQAGDSKVITLCEVELYDDELNSITISGATQSSTGDSKGPELALDGNRNTNYVDGQSCSTTTISQDPYWRANFISSSTTNHTLRIFNRIDLEPERLALATIHINDILYRTVSDPDILKNPILYSHYPLKEIFLEKPGSNQITTICEIELYDVDGNKMILGNAEMSRIWNPNRAENAVDGELTLNAASGRCASTNTGTPQWWRGYYVANKEPAAIHIYNRNEGLTHERQRIIGVEVSIDGVLWGTVASDQWDVFPIIFNAPPAPTPTLPPGAI